VGADNLGFGFTVDIRILEAMFVVVAAIVLLIALAAVLFATSPTMQRFRDRRKYGPDGGY
jgi:hypothetical protein